MSYARHQYRNDQDTVPLVGNDMDTAPRTLVNAQILWQPRENVALELDWIHSDEYYLEPQNEQAYSGHNIFNLLSTWALTDQVRLSAQITNLFDRAYAERADFTGFSGPRYFPGRPRSGFVGIEYHF
jgi:outer membrane receptor protein involved in Fe transport